jgi:hypothetical protein
MIVYLEYITLTDSPGPNISRPYMDTLLRELHLRQSRGSP